MNRRQVSVTLGTVLVLIGVWVAVAPFSRPLPGGSAFSFEATPEVGCRSPLFGVLGDDRPVVEVYVEPRPEITDPKVVTTIDCSGQARFRFSTGASLTLIGFGTLVAAYAVSRRSHKVRSS